MIEQLIADKILAAYQNNHPIIVAFCGAADLGKSYLSERTAEVLIASGIPCDHLTLDSFVMDRELRHRNNLSGYDLEAHDVELIATTLANWQQGKDIRYQPYDHKTGSKKSDFKTIEQSPILIVEGLFALHPLLLPYIDLSFFIYTSPEKLKQIKLEADLWKRNYTREFAEVLYDKEFQRYQNNVEPLKTSADFRLFLKEQWVYQIEA